MKGRAQLSGTAICRVARGRHMLVRSHQMHAKIVEGVNAAKHVTLI